MYNYIIIEGNIGAGKTSLATMIAKKQNRKLIPESYADNPFLPKFYKEPDKYAFQLELSFLAERFQQLGSVLSHPDIFTQGFIADYFIQKSLLFAKNNLIKDEFRLFSRLFSLMYAPLPQPDLIIYLYVEIDRLMENIISRGRVYEKNIKKEYLHQIQAAYLEHLKKIKNSTVLIVDTTNIDFISNQSHFSAFMELISTKFIKGIHQLKIN